MHTQTGILIFGPVLRNDRRVIAVLFFLFCIFPEFSYSIFQSFWSMFFLISSIVTCMFVVSVLLFPWLAYGCIKVYHGFVFSVIPIELVSSSSKCMKQKFIHSLFYGLPTAPWFDIVISIMS